MGGEWGSTGATGSWRTEPEALPSETQLGEKLPAPRAAPGPWLQGQHCQNWGLVTKIPWRNQTEQGGTRLGHRALQVSSCSGPMPGLCFTAQSWVKHQGGPGGMGQSMAHGWGGGINKSTEMVLL